MFEQAKAAGLTPQHVADFVRVTRITASSWFNGHAKPHSILADRIESFMEAVARATKAGTLPPPVDITARNKRKYIYEALRTKSD
jgi:hypothetical protein